VAPRRLAGIYERGRIVLGEPGIGKSVLVDRLAAEAQAGGHWVLPGVRWRSATVR
jgi:MoxR-like ATPase